MISKKSLSCFAFLLLSNLGFSAPTDTSSDRPNIVLIMADDIGLGDLSHHVRTQLKKEPIVETPNLDALASQSLWFTDGHSATALCSPTRYCVMSGNNNYRSYAPWGVWGTFRESPFKKGEATIGTVTRDAGYHTGFVGKWHLGGDFRDTKTGGIFRSKERGDIGAQVDLTKMIGGGPRNCGFHYDFTLPCGVQGPIYTAYENQEWHPLSKDSKIIFFNKDTALHPKDVSDKGPGPGDSHWDASELGKIVSQKGSDFIKSAPAEKPFFLYYCTHAVHVPHCPPEEFDGQKVKGTTPSQHLDMIVELDLQVKRLIDALKTKGVYDNTLIIFTSDNGGLKIKDTTASGHDVAGGFSGSKNSPLEGGHRVPLFAFWKNKITPGITSEPAINQDMLATFAALVGTEVPANQAQDSLNLLPLLTGEGTFTQRPWMVQQAGSKKEIIYRKAPWKLIIQSNHVLDSFVPKALYNLEKDPAEKSNLLKKPNQKNRVAQMLKEYLEILNSKQRTAPLPKQTLSPEGLKKKTTHDYLFDTFSKDRETKYVGEGRDRGLKELTILKQTREIKHGDELALPPGTEKIAGLFRHFAFHGADLDRIKEIYVYPFSPDKAPPRSKQLKDFYRVQMPSLPVSDKPYEPMKIRFLMKKESDTCRIDDLIFIAQKQIPPAFDDIPYRDLGSEHPRATVEIIVDTANELSIGGSTDLHRDRWFRMHVSPGMYHSSFENWAAERNFLPGRGFLKFNPALTRGYGKNPPQLKERPDKPGAADFSFFDRYDAGDRQRNTIPAFKQKPYSFCFNDWPEFMSVPLQGRGTPLVEHFDSSAELAAGYVADQIKDGGYTAEWWEVKNESSVQSEWAHHWKEAQGIDGWGLLAEFHNKVADAIHQKSPDTKVGGPSSAYMQLQVKDFQLFRDQARFITETKGHLDFFSHHFYENALTLGAHERRGLGYSNYLLGRYEAILDMLRAHMHKVDHVLPILITETGSLQNGREPSDNWLRLHAWNAYLTKSMQRPDQIDLFVPFIFLHMSWNPMSGDAAFTPKTDRKKHVTIDDFEPTTVANFIELWRDFDGHRLPVSFDRDWLDAVAIHDEKGVAIAVTNMGGRQLNLDLSKLAKTLGVQKAHQTRLNYHKGEVLFQPDLQVTPSAIPIDVNETTVIRFPTAAPLNPSGTLILDRWYAHQTATKNEQTFAIKIDQPKSTQHAKLIIGAHRRGGLSEPLKVQINGTPVTINQGDAHEFSEFFAPLETTIPATLLKEKNQIQISSQLGTTITSVQIQTHRTQ